MPTIAIVDGIRIVIFFNDHDPPHFHAILGETSLRMSIASGTVMGDRGPASMERKLGRWLDEHRDEMMLAWKAVRAGQRPQGIE
ncbi:MULTISPECIES: DUF4160 domain-containing protein [unclassified Aureimonas]|uniref:DUF4160 domain-containing protein n=1 Tax=unclassified Aureimonas TaxID=2615206 RepID=UPI000702089C|nr:MULTISPECIES: DUF4160 domain-containing protein [unclassified Aureimonas]KQT52623.1 hypothetical protein ASG62_15595 [Aureimonas sp. Leaf427]KQT77478.1 hypothetical protein ASG54_10815 [Aureimonas sp. Leaf460]